MLRDNEAQAPVKDIMLMLEAGCVYRYAGRFREARDIFQGVRALLPTREVADLALAGVSMDEGKLDEAAAHCQRALKLNSASAAAHAQLGEIQLLQNNRPNAIRSLQRSMEISQNGPTANLARSLLKLASIMERKQ